MKNSNPSQCQKLIRIFRRGERLTKLRATLRYGIGNLGGRVFELRKKYGLKIKTEMVKRKNKPEYAVYSL